MTVPGITGRQVDYVKEHDIILQHNYWEECLVKKILSGNWSADELWSLLKAIPSQQRTALREEIPTANISTAEAGMSRRGTIAPALQGKLYHANKLSSKKTYLLPFQ